VRCPGRQPCYWLAVFLFAGSAGESSMQMETRLYVGNLPKSTTEEDLKTLFLQAGVVSAVDVVKDRDSGQSKGFAFVTMNDQGEAEKAISMFNAYSLSEHELKVNVAKPKVPRG
jgi:RNA recognition motif-containing protein